MRFRLSEAIEEPPGSGRLIHISESDGIYNEVDHPQANLQKWAKFDDPKPLIDPSPDIDHSVSQATLDANPVYDRDGNRIL